MKSKLFNDYVQKEVELINARNFLRTFYNEKELNNFDMTDDTKALLEDMFYLFQKEYSLNFTYDKVLENEELILSLIYSEPNEIPFERIDEKDLKKLVKLSNITGKIMEITLDIEQNTLHNEIHRFWSAGTKIKQDKCLDNQINLGKELRALKKAVNSSYDVYVVEERTPFKKIKDFIEPLTTKSNELIEQNSININNNQYSNKRQNNVKEQINYVDDGYDECDDRYELR